jgi:hypothetical protein
VQGELPIDQIAGLLIVPAVAALAAVLQGMEFG